MDDFLENAQRIFDVAQADADGLRADAIDAPSQFALLVRDDGGLHFIMESPVSIEGASSCVGARTAYLVTRSAQGVRVEGRRGGKDCVIEERRGFRNLLRDQPLYVIASPLLTAAS
jgi:hypothetical protein